MLYKLELCFVVVKICMVGIFFLLGKDFVKNVMSLYYSINRMNKNFFYESLFIYLILFLWSVW